MSPSPRNPRGDSRWKASGRAASVGTLALHAGVLLGLLFTQSLATRPMLPPLPAGVVALELRPEPPPPPATVTMPEPVVPAPAVPVPMPRRPRHEATPLRSAPRTRPERVEPRPMVAPDQPAPTAMDAGDAPATDASPLPAPATAQTEVGRATPALGHSRGADMPEATPMQRVLAALAELVERHKEYPRAARRAGYQGTVLMEVTLRSDGVIGAFGLAEGSAYSLLDKATERAFARMQGMRVAGIALPEDVRVRVPVRYELH